MFRPIRQLLALLLVLASPFVTAQPASYEANFQSLSRHQAAPDWFRDAKLGIYFHWGVYSVPEFGNEWYPRNMHIATSGFWSYWHHRRTYGHPSEFGYHDFVPMFTAEKFDPAEWAELFRQSGARFAGPVAEHHDGFAMWASDVTPWNVGDKGPLRDITGELAREIRARDMKFITTFHHARNLQRYADKPGERFRIYNWLRWETRWRNSHYPYLKNMPTSSEDPELRLLYGNIPEQEWLDRMWLGKLKEVIDRYQPDIIYFDSWLDLIPQDYRETFAAYYLNKASQNGQEVVITHKQDDLPLEYSVADFEKGRLNELTQTPWMTDDTLSTGSWSYTRDLKIKDLTEVLHVFIDIVSKNGQLLLNISPRADGSIPENQRAVLLGLGKWLGEYGEAIYETRPFVVFGEGPTRMKDSGHFVSRISYTPQDIRYTTRGDTLYAIVLGDPGSDVKLSVFGENGPAQEREIESVQLMGDDTPATWTRDAQGVRISAPQAFPDAIANVYRITLAP